MFCGKCICIVSLPIQAFNQFLLCVLHVVRISAEDFSRLFDSVELCSVNPDTLTEGTAPSSASSPGSWTISEHEGVWVPGSSAGGRRKYRREYCDESVCHVRMDFSCQVQSEIFTTVARGKSVFVFTVCFLQ